jgi:hypothetical protein
MALNNINPNLGGRGNQPGIVGRGSSLARQDAQKEVATPSKSSSPNLKGCAPQSRVVRKGSSHSALVNPNRCAATSNSADQIESDIQTNAVGRRRGLRADANPIPVASPPSNLADQELDDAHAANVSQGEVGMRPLSKPENTSPPNSACLNPNDNLGSRASGEDGLPTTANQSANTILEIVELWRQRQDWARAQQRLWLQSGAICRRFCSNDKVAGEKLLQQIRKGDASNPVAVAIAPLLGAMDLLQPNIDRTEAALVKQAQHLPVAPWCAKVRGIGINGIRLASIVGECGDIGKYKSVAALWKRMGLAVIDGERQRKCLDKELALIHGYNPQRRAVAYGIGDNLLRSQKPTDPYRQAYDYRVAHTKNTHSGWYETATGKSKHGHMDAMRYMTKRFLRDFYNAWREAERGRLDSVDPQLPASP